MLIYIVRRLLSVVGVLVVISILIFSITQVMPGDVAHTIAGQFATQDVIDAIRVKLGLNDSLPEQYWRWASGIMVGDFGQSIVMERPVLALILEAFEASIGLALISFFCVSVVGILFGIITAIRKNSLIDYTMSILTYIGISVPEFFWGIVLLIVFAEFFQLLPSGGIGEFSKDPVDWLLHIILPVATLTFTLVAHVSRLTRSSMIEVLSSQYVLNAKAKGLDEKTVIIRHALRNALLPAITVLALDIGWLLGGIVVVEVVFSYPGIGRLMMFSIERHDLPLIQGSILIVALVYCLVNLAADLLYAWVNPKIRYGNAA